MTEGVNWQEVTALIASFGLIAAIFTFAVDSIVNKAIGNLKEVYMRQDVAELKFQQLDAHLTRIDTDIEPLRRDCPLMHEEFKRKSASQ